MYLALFLVPVLGFTMLAPSTHRAYGALALYALAVVASAVPALLFVFAGVESIRGREAEVAWFFFWPALAAAFCGFLPIAVLTQWRWARPASPGQTFGRLVFAVLLWVAGAAVGASVAAAIVLIVLSTAAP